MYQTHVFNKNDILTHEDMNNIIAGIDELKSLNTDLMSSKIYVSAISGNDSNDGSSWTKAKKTFANALANSSDDCTIFFEGDTNERLNILTKPSQKVLRVIGRDGVRNRLLGGTKVVDFTADSTANVYYAKLSTNNSNLSQAKFRIYQHDLNDTVTLILDEEKHPAQKGRLYRCTSTKFARVSSVSAVRSSSTFCYYFDASSLTLYIRTTTKPSTTNPIYIPTDQGSIYGNDGSCCVEFSNIETWYAPFLITKCPIAKLSDCASHYALGTGCLRYDDSVSVQLVRFEANSAQHISGYGDGINGHSTTLDSNLNANLIKPNRYSIELIDCWSHDNMDDGWSDHTGGTSVLRGGLYEYNVKGGVTPSGGTRNSCYHVLSRKNYRGFFYICATSTSKETTAWWYCQDCISMDNSIAGFDVDSNSSSLPIHALLNKCQSINDAIGYRIGPNSYVKTIDCSAHGAGTITKQESSALGYDKTQTTML
jgi:hypothetical protein